jgi:hypothetical protein
VQPAAGWPRSLKQQRRMQYNELQVGGDDRSSIGALAAWFSSAVKIGWQERRHPADCAKSRTKLRLAPWLRLSVRVVSAIEIDTIIELGDRDFDIDFRHAKDVVASEGRRSPCLTGDLALENL